MPLVIAVACTLGEALTSRVTVGSGRLAAEPQSRCGLARFAAGQ